MTGSVRSAAAACRISKLNLSHVASELRSGVSELRPELCESRGGRPWLPSLLSLIVWVDVKQHERRKNCVKVEVAVLGSPSLIVPMVSVDVKQQ